MLSGSLLLSSPPCDAGLKGQADSSPWLPDDIDIDAIMSYDETNDACDPKPSPGDNDARADCLSSGRCDGIPARAADLTAKDEVPTRRTGEQIATSARHVTTFYHIPCDVFAEESCCSSGSVSRRGSDSGDCSFRSLGVWCADGDKDANLRRESLQQQATACSDADSACSGTFSKERDVLGATSTCDSRRRKRREESPRSRTGKHLATVSKPLKRSQATGGRRLRNCRPLQELPAAIQVLAEYDLLTQLVMLTASRNARRSHTGSADVTATPFDDAAANMALNLR